MSFTISPAQREELDEIWSLAQRVVTHMVAHGNPQWGEDYPTRDFYADDIARGELMAARAPSGTVLGVACVNTQESAEYEPLPWRTQRPAMVIHRMAIDPTHQGQGIGRAFFIYTEEEARRRNIPALRIDTYGKNQRMQNLIVSRGYRPVGEIYIHGRPLGFPCFEKELT